MINIDFYKLVNFSASWQVKIGATAPRCYRVNYVFSLSHSQLDCDGESFLIKVFQYYFQSYTGLNQTGWSLNQ